MPQPMKSCRNGCSSACPCCRSGISALCTPCAATSSASSELFGEPPGPEGVQLHRRLLAINYLGNHRRAACRQGPAEGAVPGIQEQVVPGAPRSEEHTSEL